MPVRNPAAASAPGKVLFSGGFLVLDRKHTGLVLGLDARIHVHVQEWISAALRPLSRNHSFILVRSPQFKSANWLYSTESRSNECAVAVKQIIDDPSLTHSKNVFVETTLEYVLSYLVGTGMKTPRPDFFPNMQITILADESYYSQAVDGGSLKDGFRDFGCSLNEANKTGLGSSAALVTALTSGLVSFHAGDKAPKISLNQIHNLAQSAHCAAQGKVGSGFDVAAAVYGACLYRRFSPSILEAVGDPSTPGFVSRLVACIDDLDPAHKWDVQVESRVDVPRSLKLLMCDVDCGSETPGMVRGILAWRKANPLEADSIWHALQQGSDELGSILTRMCQAEKPTRVDLAELRTTIETIRSFVREESAKSNVPVEPKVITELLDYCATLPGVVGGVAPGAGGYDAVALLIENDDQVLSNLEAHLSAWKANEAHTGPSIGRVRLLKVKQAYEGIRQEDVSKYTSWL